MVREASRTMTRLLPIIFLTILFALPAAAQFHTVSAIAGEANSIGLSDGRVYVGRVGSPSVLVYSVDNSVLDVEVSLIAIAQFGIPAGVTAIGVAPDSSVLVATRPNGEIFRLQGWNATSVGRLPNGPFSDTQTLVTVIAAHGNEIYLGSRGDSAPLSAALYRASGATAITGATRFQLTVDSHVTAIGGQGRHVIVGTSDSTVVGGPRGRLYRFDTPTATLTFLRSEDSAITAIASNGETVVYAGSPSGGLRRLDGTLLATVPETIVRSLLFAPDGTETVVFVGAETSVLRRLSAGGLRDLGSPAVAGLLSVRGLAWSAAPARVYGIGRRAAQSFLFYYDTEPPRLTEIAFSIDTALRQPGTPETFTPPLTRGRYQVRIRTSERLNAIPTLRLQYADGSIQNIVLGGSLFNYSGEFTVDSSRPAGIVRFLFSGVDDAGNTGTEIVATSTFQLRDPGKVVIANNMIRPNFGEFMTVRYLLLRPQTVSIRVYNMRGQLVADLSPGRRGAGEYEDVTWRGRNSAGALVGSGVYMIRVEAGEDLASTHKVMVVR